MYMSKSHRSLRILFSRTGAGLLHVPIVSVVKFKFLVHFPVDHLADPYYCCCYYYYYYTCAASISFIPVSKTERKKENVVYLVDTVDFVSLVNKFLSILERFEVRRSHFVSRQKQTALVTRLCIILVFKWV